MQICICQIKLAMAPDDIQEPTQAQRIVSKVDAALNVAYKLQDKNLSEFITELLFALRKSLEKTDRISRLTSFRLARNLQFATIGADREIEDDEKTGFFSESQLEERCAGLANLWNNHLHDIVTSSVAYCNDEDERKPVKSNGGTPRVR